MRLIGWLLIGLAVVLAAAVPVPGQPAAPPPGQSQPQAQPMKKYADPMGRFTIEYPTDPTDWIVNTKIVGFGDSGTVFSGFTKQAFVDVAVADTVEADTTEGFGRSIEAERRKTIRDYQLLQDGMTDLAGKQAYYVYYTGTYTNFNYYSLRVYLVFPVERPAAPGRTFYRHFWFDGSTINVAQNVRDLVPIIQRIIWSFRPT